MADETGPTAIVTLTEVRAGLNIPGASHDADTELRAYIAAATEVVESIVGPVLPRTVTEVISPSRSIVVLSMPATSITEVTDDGTVRTDYDADLSAGILTSAAGWSGPVTVEYEVGLAAVPASVNLAARELVRFWWQQGQQAGRPAFGGSGAAPQVSTAYAVPDRVVELLRPHIAGRLPGFA